MKKTGILLILLFISNKNALSETIIKNNDELFENKKILIIGGTGYLGKAIAFEVLKYNPRKIFIYGRDEVKHYHSIKGFQNNPKITNIIGDIRDLERLLWATKGVDIVFHAAALKRMDALEFCTEEAIKTNILGSLNVFKACCINEVDKVLFISTDKACLPINCYGATKFISEKIFTNYDKQKIKTKFMVARFGNILESTGSVIPIFREKIKNGEDIPLTDKRMTRFIVAKEEAVELLFDALRYGNGGEIFIKQLPAFRIIDLIKVLKEKENVNNPIKIIGLRAGEKIHEVLIDKSEFKRAYCFKEYYIITPTIVKQTTLDKDNAPLYVKLSKNINRETVKKYTSQQAVLSINDLKYQFKQLKLL